ncbi:LacI family DNA-binding transcriptional regulator [Ramlibacter terrae]|uniref:LacI family DNA-binding transcriptional regulator n=1 Tax=Ramlibacter terrae TaxID=2732511 RepID=A0ABX6P3Y5_9BURK|nr:LacI family DNA-binding transcriptional regulator [Ramlibacter terrae]
MSIEAVAREAGVSVATVSRVFNAPDLVRPPTREKVEKVALRLGYRANASAQTLRTQRSKVIGVVLPTLLNPVFAECPEGIAATAAEHGYSIIPVTTSYRLADEEAAVARLAARSVDGMVLVVANPAASPALKRLRAAKVPYVLAYNRHAKHPCVSVDHEAAVADVVHRLVARGHRRIAMVSGQLSASDRAQQRHRGFVRGLGECGLSAGTLLEVPFMEHAVQHLTEFLRGPARPTALFCSNDLLAIRTVRAAWQMGLRVPADLSVVGFDGIELGPDLTPSLGTVVQPNREIGIQCVRLLAGAMAAGRPLVPKASLTPDHSFRDGESPGPPPAS